MSKRKQRLYKKLLKQRCDKNYEKCKICKNLFEKLKKQSKKFYFQNTPKHYENNMSVIGKSKICNDKFPKSLNINKEEITDKNVIGETFNKFFINVGSNVADKIPPSSTNFQSYLLNITTVLIDKPLSEKEFKNAFFTLKTNRSTSHNLYVNVIRNMYHELKIPLMDIFSQSLSTGIFPDKMKIAKVSTKFKKR